MKEDQGRAGLAWPGLPYLQPCLAPGWVVHKDLLLKHPLTVHVRLAAPPHQVLPVPVTWTPGGAPHTAHRARFPLALVVHGKWKMQQGGQHPYPWADPGQVRQWLAGAGEATEAGTQHAWGVTWQV